jgi:putative phosphoesterase
MSVEDTIPVSPVILQPQIGVMRGISTRANETVRHHSGTNPFFCELTVCKRYNALEVTGIHMTLQIGLLSDTHLTGNSAQFRRLVESAFSSCETIIHAGDLTDQAILDAFGTRTVYAVHGNMCSRQTKQALPESRVVRIHGHQIAICHGTGLRSTIEDRLFERFSEMDCVVYGHTHQPTNHYVGTTLFVNPGSFQSTGPYGHPGSYGILFLDQDRVRARVCSLQEAG